MKKVLPILMAIVLIILALIPFFTPTPSSEHFTQEFYEKIYPIPEVVAIRTYENDIYTLEIQHGLTELEEGQYIGWLIRLNPFKIINLGFFENGYLKYQVESPEIDYKTFTEVIITVESDSNTDIPNDEHIVEASFS